MTRRHRVTALLLLALAPAAMWAAGASPQTANAPGAAQSASTEVRRTSEPSPTELERLELQFLAAKSAPERQHVVSELKALASHSIDSSALNTAVIAMLPQTDSAAQAEELLAISAANPAGMHTGAGVPSYARSYLVDARRAARAARNPVDDIETIADIRIDVLRKDSLGRDGLTTALVQQVWRINTAEGAAAFSPHSLMYAAMSERLVLHRARLLKRNGREIEATASTDQPVIEHSSGMYFDSRTRDLNFAKIEPGDLVEIQYELLPAADLNPWGGYYARLDMFRDSSPTRLRRRVVIAPTALKLYTVAHGVPAAMRYQHGEQTVRVWEARQLPAQPYEPLSPGASSMGPYLHVSTIGSAEEFGRWYSGLLEPGLKLTPSLQAIAKQIEARNLNTAGKVQAVYESVQRGTHYVAFEFGVHSYQPYTLETVERRGFGDCKDKAAMIVALLRAVGVQAEFAMVRTRSAGEVSPDAYSVQLFNHAVAFVPELDLYLDGTAEYAAPGELPFDDQGATVITVAADGQAMRRKVPFATPDVNRVTRQLSASLAADGRVDFVAQTAFSGYFAAEQRRSCESADLAGSYRQTLAQFYPKVKIAHAVAEGTARASREVDLKLEGSLDAAQGEHEVTLRSSLDTAGLTRRFASQKLRKNPLLVPVTPGEHELFDYDLPEGAQVKLPDDVSLRTEFGRVEVTYHRVGNKLHVETYTELVPQTVAPSGYQAFRAFCRTADEALQREFRIVLP